MTVIYSGMEDIQPLNADKTRMYTRPHFFKRVNVIFGSPIDVSDLVARAHDVESPLTVDELEELYEDVASRLETVVKKLRAELFARLGMDVDG